MEQNGRKPPLHTRFGLRLLQLLIIVLSLVLVKRCVDLYDDNKITDQQIQMEYFEKGFASGMKKSKGYTADPEPQFENYTLKKSYRDGYRQGWDSAREEEKQQ